MEKQENKGEIIIYKSDSGPELQIKLENDSVWLTQAQMAELFDRDRDTISEHIQHVYKTAELSPNSVTRKFRVTARDGKSYNVEHYNLDMIISVGYRVNSKRGTQFRIWATKHLRGYLLKGYLINERRLRENQDAKLKELQQAHLLIQQALESRRLDGFEKELVNIITDYTNTWIVLNEYDSGKLKISDVSKNKTSYLDFGKVTDSVSRFKNRLQANKLATADFGKPNGNKLQKILTRVKQNLDGVDVYPSAEEKGAHLFYFLISEKPFADGNKRIASLIFILFLIENHLLYNRKGERRINDSALAALALLVAESKPSQKDVMVKLIVNLINKK
ncbi:MAG TPA: virulence protein RhuM/Fic/DOC family protein [Patescibacteria group bacterium]|nr:virulence protein RhuM/Fic/DOC family protein [Patescibacteria group bacterium]